VAFLAFEVRWSACASMPGSSSKIGAAPPDEWPAWLARAGQKLGVRWAPDFYVSSSFRGAKRERIVSWLKGA
jgi:hypothetical protein